MGSHSRHSHATAPRFVGPGPRWQHVALGLATAATISGAGGVGYALTVGTSLTSTAAPSRAPAAPATAAVTSASTPAATPAARPATSGPTLVDRDGRALAPALAQRVTAVYTALANDDLEAIR